MVIHWSCWGGLLGLFVLILLFLFWPDLKNKIRKQNDDKEVGLMIDAEEIHYFSKQSNYPPQTVRERFEKIPVLLQQEYFLKINLTPCFELQLKNEAVFLPRPFPDKIVKAHRVRREEMRMIPLPQLRERLLRAVRSRWVRLLFIELDRSRNFDQNLNFLVSLVQDLELKGYQVGTPLPFPRWPSYLSTWIKNQWGVTFSDAVEAIYRLRLCILLAFLTPSLLIWFALNFPFSNLAVTTFRFLSPCLAFLLVSCFSLVIGILIHSLGSIPEIVLGLTPLRGVKLLLVLPLMLSFVQLLSRDEKWRLPTNPLRSKPIIIGGALALTLFGLYLTRSGNYPLIPVTNMERGFRDMLETWFQARPRFKEFLIGHPLMLLGLYWRQQGYFKDPSFFRDGRLLLGIGLVGQISILNTFLHFHAPFFECVLRTLHGVWLGLLLGFIFCWGFKIREVKMKETPWRKEKEVTLIK